MPCAASESTALNPGTLVSGYPIRLRDQEFLPDQGVRAGWTEAMLASYGEKNYVRMTRVKNSMNTIYI
ncbi:hypothetical protein DPMN_053555 [Dreissena polymorpha]|uniref:Uncharacterized protein n=1 Tax=Dreissena polymorpha TaxID=45954 RepID=A0A9D4HQS7_DREPO|nr:hypothetical protein DPMN_053555 [Dreissena polymorpha]